MEWLCAKSGEKGIAMKSNAQPGRAKKPNPTPLSLAYLNTKFYLAEICRPRCAGILFLPGERLGRKNWFVQYPTAAEWKCQGGWYMAWPGLAKPQGHEAGRPGAYLLLRAMAMRPMPKKPICLAMMPPTKETPIFIMPVAPFKSITLKQKLNNLPQQACRWF